MKNAALEALVVDLKLWACSPRVPMKAQLVMLEAIGRLAPPEVKDTPQATISVPGQSSDIELLKMALGNTAACLGDALALYNKVAGYEAFKNSAQPIEWPFRREPMP